MSRFLQKTLAIVKKSKVKVTKQTIEKNWIQNTKKAESLRNRSIEVNKEFGGFPLKSINTHKVGKTVIEDEFFLTAKKRRELLLGWFLEKKSTTFTPFNNAQVEHIKNNGVSSQILQLNKKFIK